VINYTEDHRSYKTTTAWCRTETREEGMCH